jgi:preprotein translocase subunit SecD
MGKRQLMAFFIALLMFSMLSLLYSSRVIADLKQLYQDPPATLGAELILRPQTADTSIAAQTDLATIQEAVSQRLDHLYLAGTYSVTTQNDRLVVNLSGSENLPYVASVLSSIGKIAFVDGGTEAPPIGQAVQTSTQADPQANVYRILFTGQEIEAAKLPDSTTGQIFYQLTLQPAAAERLATFVEAEPGGYICMVMDGYVLNCSVMYHQAGNSIEILPGLSSGTGISLADLAIFLESGPLPVPLEAEIH